MIYPITHQKSVSWVNFMQHWLKVAQLFRLLIFDPTLGKAVAHRICSVPVLEIR